MRCGRRQRGCAGRVCARRSDPARDPAGDPRLRQGFQLLDRPNAACERRCALGRGERGPGCVLRRHERVDAPAVHPVSGRHAGAPERWHDLASGQGKGVYHLPAGHRPCEPAHRRSRPRDRHVRIPVAAPDRQEAVGSNDNAHWRGDDAARGAADVHRGVLRVTVALQRCRDSERGGVLVLVALWMPLVAVTFSFVMDAGNWFEHRRHLQTQADAGALAGGGLFNGCFGSTSTANAAIEAEARKYAGDPGTSQPYNLQIGGVNQGTITVRFNRKTFAAGGPPADDTVEAGACDAKMVDVKLTEANLPWFLGGKVVPAVNARARGQIQQKGSSSDSLPVGVPDNNPVDAAAIFIDESSGNAVLGTQALVKSPATPVSLNGENDYQWVAPTGLSLNISHPNTGIVIALAGKTGILTGGSLTAICNRVLVECYSVTQDATTGN